uniref:Uncharacterized protein n=1 Tax=Arundo donax TaxID=35708 RepID=A0A0A9BS14_ARUDO
MGTKCKVGPVRQDYLAQTSHHANHRGYGASPQQLCRSKMTALFFRKDSTLYFINNYMYYKSIAGLSKIWRPKK